MSEPDDQIIGKIFNEEVFWEDLVINFKGYPIRIVKPFQKIDENYNPRRININLDHEGVITHFTRG